MIGVGRESGTEAAMRTRVIAIFFLVGIVTGMHPAGGQDQWAQFRGPRGRGVAADDAALPVEFGPSNNLVWKSEVGSGISSPCIWGDRIFLTASDGEELVTIAIDRSNGSVLWRHAVTGERKERLHPQNHAASSTPTTDGERVYCYFGAFGLICYDNEGNEQWVREMPFLRNLYGTAASPIVAEGYLILIRDTDTVSTLEAIDGETGETIWRKDRTGFKSSWSTPALWRHDGKDQLLIQGVWWLTAYDLADGSELWSVPGLTDEPIITPVTGDGLVFVTSYNMNTNPEVIGLPEFSVLLEECDANGDGVLSYEETRANKSILSRLDADGEGDHPLAIFCRFLDEDKDQSITEKEYGKIFEWLGSFEHVNALLAIRPGSGEKEVEIVWTSSEGVPECPSPLYHDGRVYLLKNGGIVSCFDARTGEVKYRERIGSGGPYYASLVCGDGKLFAASTRGVVTVFRTGDELEVLSRNDLGERIMATPALVDGKIFVRTARSLYAFGATE